MQKLEKSRLTGSNKPPAFLFHQLKFGCGFPQRSVVVPKQFILYIKDFVSVTKLLKYILFAYDKLFYSGENTEKILEVIQTEFMKIPTWFKLMLSLNLEKTNYIFGKKKK